MSQLPQPYSRPFSRRDGRLPAIGTVSMWPATITRCGRPRLVRATTVFPSLCTDRCGSPRSARSNAADLLFDDVLWVSRAQQEHDAFANALRSRGVVVHYYSDLLAQALDVSAARDYILDGVFDSRYHGPLACDQLRAAVAGLDSPTLAGYLVGGITKREINELAPEPKSIAFHSLDPDGFVLVPLPNLLYQRDTSCWIYGGVSINAMRRQ